MIRQIIALVGILIFLTPSLSTADTKGTFQLNGKSVTLTEAISYTRGDEKIIVVLTDKPLPKGRLQPAEGVQGVSLTIEGKQIAKIVAYHNALGDSSWSTSDTQSIQLNLAEQNEKAISGKASLQGGPIAFADASLDSLDVQFKTGISTPEEILKGN